MNRNRAGLVFIVLKNGMDRRQRMEIVLNRNDVARSRHPVRCRCEERKLNRPSQNERELASTDLDRLTLFVTARDDTERLRLALAFEADVKRMSRSATDSLSHAPADEGIVCGSSRDSQLKGLVLQDPDRRL